MDNLAYKKFKTFLEESSGIVLGDNKQYLVESRLSRIMKDHKFSDLQELLNSILAPGSNVLKQSVIDAMTTNETLWFRDGHPFEYLKKALLETGPSSSYKIWCAACSSGQEPYSVSICIEELINSGKLPRSASFEIIATDISKEVLAIAKEGLYGKLALARGLSEERLKANFTESSGGNWKLNGNIANRVKFKELNLNSSYSHLGKFDLIFCRNVLIYFSESAKNDILQRMHTQLKPSGKLFLGSSESLNGFADYYKMHHYKPGFVYVAI